MIRIFQMCTTVIGLIVVVSMAASQAEDGDVYLVLIDVMAPEHLERFSRLKLPVYTVYEGKAVTEVSEDQWDLLSERELEPVLLDVNPQGRHYFLLTVPHIHDRIVRDLVTVLDSRNGTFLFRASPADAELAGRYGFGLTRISKQPFADTVKKPHYPPRPATAGEGAFLQSIVDNVSQNRITATVQRLQDFQTRYSYTDSCQAAGEYLYERFAGFGLSVVYDPFEYNGEILENIVAVHPGLTDPNQVYIICGHYDSINNHGDPWTVAPGADDNASGTAAVVEAARVLCAYDFRSSIYCICFSGEEQGCIGSGHYSQWAFDQGLDIRGVINLDMIAYVDDPPYDAWDINIYGDGESCDLALFMADMVNQHTSAVPYTINTGQPQRGSDHYPFALKGYKAIFGIDAQMWGAPDWNPYYHSAGDTLGTLNLPYATDVVKAAVAAVASLAEPIGAGDTQKPTMESIIEPQGQYYSQAPVFSNFGFDDDTALDDGWYQVNSYSGGWTVLFSNVIGTSWDGDGWTFPGFQALDDGGHVIYFKAKDDAGNLEGESGEWSWRLYKDTTPPEVPLVSSPTHPDEPHWYGLADVTVNWGEPDDLSGVVGYSYLMNHDPLTVPDETVEGVALEKEYFDVPDGVHYFHCRAGDNVFLWGPTAHFTIRIDTEPPPAPLDLSVVPAGWSNHPLFTVSWTDPQDLSGTAGAYYRFDTPPVSHDDGLFTSARPCSIVTTEEGSRPLYLWLRDGAGNSNYSLFNSTVLHYDVTAPSQGSITIANGADTTSTLTVALNGLHAFDGLSGMGPGALMQFSNDGWTWAPTEPFETIKADWVLSAYGGSGGSGLKNVYVRYQDVAGNWSGTFSDDIVCSLPLEILTQTLPQATLGFAYLCTLSAAGGWPPYTWHIISGKLPSGLALDSAGILFGMPDSAEIVLFGVAVTDTAAQTQHIQLSIQTNEPSLGDVNGDGQIDIIDVVLSINIILELLEPTSAQRWGADCNGDAMINILDTMCIVSIVLEGT